MNLKLRAALVALALCVSLFRSAAEAEPLLDADARSRVDAAVEQAIARHVTPGAAVVIGTADRILFARGYGRLTYDETSPAATLDTIYDLASVSKAVGTASATMLLIQDGRLNLDDPVRGYIPAFDREDKRDVTVRHLLSHTSGLPAYTSAAKVEADRREGESKADALIRCIVSLPLRHETGKGHVYACLNFITLARVNEEAAGRSQEEFLRERLFDPLGMNNTGYSLTEDQKSRAAPTIGGRNYRQGTVHDPLAAYYSDTRHSGGNAGLFSSANDLARFCQMVLSNGRWGERQVFTPQTIDLFATNAIPLRVRKVHGLGWERYLFPPYATRLNRGFAKAVLGHGGYTGTFVRLDRLAGTFVVVLTNRCYPDDNGSDWLVRRGVLKVVLETDPIYKDVLTLH